MYIADTNIYVTAANEPEFRRSLETFIGTHGPLAFSSVVLAEIVIGIPDPARHAPAVRALTAGFRPLNPTADDWLQAAGVIARLGGDVVTKTRSFWNDSLLAAQCARVGAKLLTRNTEDFRRLRRYIAVRAVPPFP